MSGFAAGSFDRRIAIEQRIVTRDPTYNTAQETWQPFATVWAQVREILPSRAEGVEEGLSMAKRPARVRIRYRPDVSSDMRFVYEGRILEIISGPAELGRREAMEFMAQELSTSGEAP